MSAIAGKPEYLDTIDGGNWNYGDSSYPQSEMTLVTGTFFRNPLMMAVVWNILREIQRGGIELVLQQALHDLLVVPPPRRDPQSVGSVEAFQSKLEAEQVT